MRKFKCKTTEQMIEDNKTLRAELEAKQSGCTSEIPALGSSCPTLDEIFSEENELKAVEAGLASKSAVDARGESLVGRYVKPLKDQLRDGDVTAAQVNKASEILRLESTIATYKPGTKTHSALSTKIANLRAEWQHLPKPKPKK